MERRNNLFFWRLSESAFKLVAGVRPISRTPNLFLIASRRYMGKPFIVDGVEVKRFDRVLEIHMNNEMVLEILQQYDNMLASSVRLLKEARRSLPVMAEHVRTKAPASAQVLYGITFINRGIERLGFSVFPMGDGLFAKFTQRHLRKLFQTVNPHAGEFLAEHEDLYVPKLVAISKANLLSRYDRN